MDGENSFAPRADEATIIEPFALRLANPPPDMTSDLEDDLLRAPNCPTNPLTSRERMLLA